jgi:hypothetical protein
MGNFNLDQRKAQIVWRKNNISNTVKGRQNGSEYQHIIPKQIWTESLWSGIRTDLPKYLKSKNIHPHSGVHNLVSSWVISANLYFPIYQEESLKGLMLEFLKQKISSEITEISEVTLEFAFSKGNALHPAPLLGEQDGNRGSGQTSPDVAFIVKTKTGKGIILTECKFTEHSFYRCSARRITDKGVRKANPDSNRCMLDSSSCNYENICHQTVWGRKYWSLLKLSNKGKSTLQRCPAATAGYQLFRQQALAEGIMQSGDYSLVVSSVAFDNRNEGLKRCLKRTGIDDFQTGWGDIFDGKAKFKTWTHQEWVQFVRDNQTNGEFTDWLNYLKERYNY